MRRSAEGTASSSALPRDPILSGLTLDSRKVRPGYLFAALSGAKQDGAAFVADAVKKGAVAILAAPDAALPPLDPGIVVLRDANPRRRVALMAAAFAGLQPDTIAAVTGTNGKSSTVHFVRHIWSTLGFNAASVGTLGIVSPGLVRDGGLTTPDPVQLHEDIAALAREGVTHLAIEASSHGLDQHRLDGLRLSAAAFTNLTHEHLDYHVSMDDYFAAKARLFDTLLPAGGTAVVNADSDRADALAALCQRRGIRFWTYGIKGREFRLLADDPTPTGQVLCVEVLGKRHEIALPLVGGFQASNALAALGLVVATGGDPDRAVTGLTSLTGAPGRLQLVARHRSGAAVYVDYAHKPEALETVLRTLRPFARGKLVVVFGCGGDRDRGKRPVMGEIATRLADLSIVTDDNPRSEEPEAIRAEILRGITADRKNWIEATDGRHAAIEAGMAALAGPDDLLLIAGKGHETGQTIKGVTHHFDDAEVARELAGAAA
ncbi:UDP-N-acetylmuramoyl-L-alanyl-D-glutamate--2,6-diaminopimelate ligase [Reyranella sp.]|uniref:UDP-N-acetylmuramoyl-L-alanyl-D-glutamate--2, 6-diaminopimelate ligase n=1 Tax=Reyranella sp. TaxID=1929291 RepID=UPI001214B854|nr:UDP-N-acetylmuramoyl-L-alanyl-D-glutamate--2,6-diaminopimelate ligase [Reyranella sp.]TAJ84046.1 MAG: UDP-N-acetylmuramoyl-L-alanyl-D-glutamate--2,6-diaminopimelate ligase [Reyranella sp.]